MISNIARKIKSIFSLKKSESAVSASEASRLERIHNQSDKDVIHSRSASQDDMTRTRRRKGGTGKNKRKKGTNRPKEKAKPQTPLILPELITPPAEEGKLRFTDLDIAPELLAGIQDLNFKYCTPIQEMCLPHALPGKDITGKAQTGTGKTAAFLISAMTRLLRNPDKANRKRKPRVLVLAPTRELAIQIHKDADALGKYTGLNNMVVFGGMGHRTQREELEKSQDILIGTPGRIIDYTGSRHLDLSEVEILIIDEADRMLDMGFIPDVRRIVRKTPRPGVRQTMFFSATLTPEILRLVDSWLQDPVTVEIEPDLVVTDLIDQIFYAVSADQKLALLLSIIKKQEIGRMLVFGNRKDSNSWLTNQLRKYGISCEQLSGDVPQQKRLKILEQFRSGRIKIIVATDVAARGIHVDGVTHVVNYDLPERPEDYVHRIGRTGRAGEKGNSISFVCEFGAYAMSDIEEYLGKTVATTQPESDMFEMPEPDPNYRPPKKKSKNSGKSNSNRRSSSHKKTY